MHACVKIKRRRIVLAVLGLAFFSQAQADFKVTEIQPTLADGVLTLTGNLDLNLSSRVEEALAKGIPLEVNIDIRLYHPRRFLWNMKIGEWTLTRRIQYHALSGQYLLSSGKPGAETRESLLTQQEALKQLGTLNDLKFPIKESLAPNNYSVDLRVSLDIEALPTPLRPVAYTSRSWHLNSGWTTWKVAP
ncbi:MAG: DUF4390 domain-containing protein [Gammaproteobacteria bacterium]|nr:DUF4390 domain-containing protein [Gammaproteobacteria bacterium]